MKSKKAPKRAPKTKPLSPVFDKSRRKWRLSVPPTSSSTGKRQQLFFDTEGAATIEAQRIKGMANKWGSEGRKIRADLATDAAKAEELLSAAGLDITLTTLAKDYIETQVRRSQSVTFREAWKEFRESREMMSDEHCKALDLIGTKLVGEIGKVNLRDLDAGQVEAAIKKHFKSPHAFNRALRSVSPLFNMAVKRDPSWIDENPCKRIEKKDTGRAGPVTVLSVDECRKMIAACCDWSEHKGTKKNYRVDATDALPALVIMMFTGVRPAEIQRLEWEDVDLDEGTIFISNQKAKTDRSREIEMPDTLREWLEYCAPKEPRTGAVCPPNWKRKIQVLRQKAKIGRSGRDQLRKSFASYHLRAFDDVKSTRSIMGHETADLIFTNYRNAVRKKDALQFWQILPTVNEVAKASA
jgi:integrase